MESANKVPASQSSKQIQRTQFPQTFQQALAEGWEVLSEVTSIYPPVDKRGKRRYGTLTMGIKGQSLRLNVPYSATIKDGFRFEAPQLLQ